MAMPPVVQSAEMGTFSSNHYVLKRKLLKLIGGTFHIFDASGVEVLRAEQKGFKLKEDIRLLGGPGLQQEMVGIFARQVMDFAAAYDVVDLQTNVKLGAFRRKGWSSIVRDEWHVLDIHDQQVGVMIEDDMTMALLRRFLSNLIPQNYDLKYGERRMADLKQNFNPFSYHLNVDFDVPADQFDRRMGLAGAVLLAAIEGRQSG